jgi:hypothetical protein
MFMKRSLLIYLLVIVILTIVFVVSNAKKVTPAWWDKVDPREKALIELELKVPTTKNDINMTKAAIFYKERQNYCDSFKEGKERLICYKRTLPIWSEIYREKEHRHK